ncbi:MAG: putative membrane protein SirB2 [Bacteriovoracaceae bacterium]|jgi:uncharacterized membrane protein SirB2
MSYEFYKIVHYITLFIFVSGLSISFLAENPPKLAKILTGISSIIILVAGMGLIAKGLNIGHGEGWPGWLHAKITIWAIVAIGGPIASKRLTSHRGLALSVLLVLMFVAIAMAVTKPF